MAQQCLILCIRLHPRQGSRCVQFTLCAASAWRRARHCRLGREYSGDRVEQCNGQPNDFHGGYLFLNICLQFRGWRVRAARHKFVTFIFSNPAGVNHWGFRSLSMASDNPMVHARVKSQHVYRVIPMPIILVSTMPHVSPIIFLFF